MPWFALFALGLAPDFDAAIRLSDGSMFLHPGRGG